MPDVRRVERGLRDPADREDATPAGELAGKRDSRFDLGSGRPAIRAAGARMRRHDVPEEHVALDSQLLEHAMHDRRARLGRPASRELPLGRKGNARNARAAVAGRFPYKQDRRVGTPFEVAREALRQAVVAVLIERVADPRGCKALYQRSQRTTSSSARRSCVMRLETRLAFGSGLPLPIVTPATTATSSGMPSSSLNACISGTVTP